MNPTTVVHIGDKNYEIKFPTISQVMEIESKKVLLSDNTYREQVQTGTRSAKYNLDLIDTIAHFMVLIPELKKDIERDLDGKNILQMSAIEAKILVKAYLKDFRPWYEEFLKELYSDVNED